MILRSLKGLNSLRSNSKPFLAFTAYHLLYAHPLRPRVIYEVAADLQGGNSKQANPLSVTCSKQKTVLEKKTDSYKSKTVVIQLPSLSRRGRGGGREKAPKQAPRMKL